MTDSSTAYVLLVDDDEDDRFLLQEVFRQYCPDCKLSCVEDSEQLLNTLANSAVLPALILLDLNMPFMSGFEMLPAIKTIPGYRSIPVVILTTSDQPTDRQKALELGADDFMTKPATLYQFNQLILKIKQRWLQPAIKSVK
ncbi:response regulator [Spirosoma sp. BT702]|uniref:Response regulator n=1 Tax=Spirosoma profusum TaxID=2771354 RepID=A0A927AP45_9BACT|nr:response regulator [Spirosoma profusum]MBD2703244.1 response regulator [Spirosoma profusum]